MKIAYHHRTRSQDAQGIHIQEIVQAFSELGHDVRIVSLVDSIARWKHDRRERSVSRWTRSIPSWLYETLALAYNLHGYRQLARMISTWHPDFIYERYALNTLCGVWASRRFGVPLILEVNAPLAYEQEQLGALTFKRLARRTERWACSKSSRTIVVSGVMRDMLAEEGVPKEHMIVMPNGINPCEFHPAISGERMRQRYALGRATVVGFVGWFRPWHGLDMLIEVMHRAGLFSQGVRLLLVGDGPAYPGLLRYAEAHDLLPGIVFTGPVERSEIPEHIAAMDIAVQPSAAEYACPMKIIEYMAMGRCIVAPRQPNIRELLTDGETGILFVRNDPDDLRARLETVLRDTRLRIRLGERAAEAVMCRGLHWQANAERAVQLAQSLGG